jgi:hypothetical protein
MPTGLELDGGGFFDVRHCLVMEELGDFGRSSTKGKRSSSKSLQARFYRKYAAKKSKA